MSGRAPGHASGADYVGPSMTYSDRPGTDFSPDTTFPGPPDAAGEPHDLGGGEVRRTPKALVQAIPFEPPVRGSLPAFLSRVRAASRQYRVLIRVVPVPGFRSSQ